MAPTQTAAYPWHQKIPRLGTDAEFTALRRLLQESGYTDEGICRRLNVEDLTDYSAASAKPRPLEQPLDALIRLFFDSALVEEDVLSRALPADAIALLDSLDLLVHDPSRPGTVFASVAILLANGIVTVCDRGEVVPDGSKTELPPDVVYPAILDTTRRFLQGLPDTPCDAMLDVGTGTGIAALLGARNASHVWATDITARAARFAEFNRRLAGIENMTVAEGDLYAPVETLTFDRVTIHPPYVPAKKSKFVFRDAGQDGEQIIRRAIEGLPALLRPGGRFYSLQLATDRQGQTFEQRIRSWLGPQEAQYDVLVGAHSIRTPAQFLADSAGRKTVSRDESVDLKELWEETKTTHLVYGAVLIERHETPRPPITGRIQTGKGYTGRHLEWLLEWQKAMTRTSSLELLSNCHPSVAPDCTLHVVSRVRDGRFHQEEFTLKSQQPFSSSFRCEGWVTQILSDCDGNRPWHEHYDRAKSEGLIGAGVAAREFAGLLSLLVSLGILRVPEFPLPAADGTDEDEEE
ncbi:MAG TPA: methyltransferase [Bryobacteraceae bacterium]|jgi:carbamoyltransferase